MKIKNSEKIKVPIWLNKHWVGRKSCPICQNNNWSLSDTIYEFRPFQHGGLTVGGPVIPTVVITCTNCGHTLFFNAIKLDIVKVPKGKEEGDNAKS